MNIKLLLITIGVSIALGTLFYTQNLVKKLQEREKQTVELYASSLEFAANSNNFGSDVTFIFQNIIQKIDFPLILTDNSDPLSDSVIISGNKNILLDSTLSAPQLRKELLRELAELSQMHEAIIVMAPDSSVLQKIYYGDSPLVKQLRYYPYFQIGFALLFILIAYSSFSYIKKSEQSNIWVGMSKETAHQLGTPISSLMGWNEILKMNYTNPDKVLDTSEEISSDLNRLNKITKRFSKIGSKPELKEEYPFEVIQKVISYFQRRLPQLGKNVNISIEGVKDLTTQLNAELFEWVIENLIKNALDAIEINEGIIKFIVSKGKNTIEIEVIDNGKGIEYKNRKNIFRPGFSTKRRGWGLGLSLSRRIVENYHNGKIFVKDSTINSGTVFKIILPLRNN
jgi:signal transduction histidine kinase